MQHSEQLTSKTLLYFSVRFPFLEPPSMTNIETAISFLKEQVSEYKYGCGHTPQPLTMVSIN